MIEVFQNILPEPLEGIVIYMDEIPVEEYTWSLN